MSNEAITSYDSHPEGYTDLRIDQIRTLVKVMSKGQRIDVKMTFKFADAERENFRNDTPVVNKLLNRKPDDEISKSTIVRAAVWNLHEAVQRGVVPKWLKDYLNTKPPAESKAKAKPRRPKKILGYDSTTNCERRQNE